MARTEGPAVGWEAVAAATPAGVAVLDGEQVVHADDRFASLLGYDEAGDLVDRALGDLYELAASDRSIDDVLATLRATGEWHGSARGRHRNGSAVPVELRLRATDDGVVCVVPEWTDGDRDDPDRRGPGRFTEELVENAPFSILRIDGNFELTYINPRTEEITGQPASMESRAIGVDIRELPSVAETGEAHRFTQLEDGETVEFEFPFESLYGRKAYFTGRGVPLIRDGEFEGAVLMAVDISERRQQERELERQRDELDTLNRINELLLAVARDLFESSIQDDIERTVCERLADSGLYRFAWIGKPAVDGDRLRPDALAGVDAAVVESIAGTTGEAGGGPVGRAFRTGELQVSQDVQTDPSLEGWKGTAATLDVRSVAAIPLAYDGTTYGVLAVYAGRPLAFSRREQRGFEMLGEATGYAINASRTRKLLFAEQVTELEFRLTDASEFVLDASDRLDCALSLEGYIPTREESWLTFFSLREAAVARFVDLAREEPAVESVSAVGEDGDPVVAMTMRSSFLDEIATLGGRITAGSFERGHGTVLVEVPQSTAIAEFVEQIRSIYPGTELQAKRDGERPANRSSLGTREDPVDITDRQQEALEAAYHAGYFELPRESSAGEVADLLGVSRPTFQAHLRKATRELLGGFVEGAKDVGGDRDR